MHDGDLSLHEFLDYPIKNYKEWKTRRKFLIKTLGPYLLSFSEAEITTIFTNMETELHILCTQRPTPEHVLRGLLEISILHFFKKSYDQIRELFPLITNQTTSMNRDICRAAMCCIRYVVEGSHDNVTLLKEPMDLARDYLKQENVNRYIFNALVILKEIARFIPSEIFIITLKHTSEIWRAACSDDTELSVIGSKVMEIHIINTPSNVKDTFAQSILIDCENVLHENKPGACHGAVLVCRAIYQHFPSLFNETKTSDILSKLLKAASTQSSTLLCVIYDFIMVLAQNFPSVFQPKANEYLLVLISQLMNGIGLPILLDKLNNLIHMYVINKYQNVQIQSVIDLVSFLAPNMQYIEYEEQIFDLLLNVLNLYPTTTVQSSIFLKCPPCKKYLQAIRARPSLISDLREYLMEQFAIGIQTRSSLNEQLVSVKMVQLFDTFLFEAGEPLFEIFKPFVRSRYEEVRSSMAKTLAMFKTIESNNELLRMSFMDESKKVRLKALKYLDPSLLVQYSEAVTQLLVDSSFKVRRMALPLISIASKMSITITPLIVVFMNDFFASNVANSSPSRSAKTCSLLPVIGSCFQQGYEPFMTIITWLCLQFLYQGDEIEPVEPNTFIGEFEQKDILQCSHRDMIANSFASSNEISEKDVNKMRVYKCENEKWLEKRNTYLFMALGNLSLSLMSYLKQVIPVFVKTFNSKHTEVVYLSAIDALIKIILASESKFNFLTVFPDLLPSLLHLLSSESTSQQLAIAILKLTGTIGASRSSTEDQEDNTSVKQLFSAKSISYFTSYVMTLLIDIMKKDATPSVFEALTSVFVYDSENAVPYLKPVITTFLKVIEHDPKRNVLWNQLEMICLYSDINVLPYVDDMLPTLLENINLNSCINVCIVLSYNLKNNFEQSAKLLYPAAVHHLDTKKDDTFKYLVKLITLSIIFQNQCIEMFIDHSERLLNSGLNDYKTSKIMKAMSTLIQFQRMQIFSARMARMALQANSSLPQVHQLIYNVFMFGNIPEQMLNKLKNIPNIDKIKDAIDKGIMEIESLPFIKQIVIKLPTKTSSTYKNVYVTFKKDIVNVFDNPKKPQVYNNSKLWMDELVQNIVENSPIVAIRSCYQVIGQSHQFRYELFPIAFLSCWKNASKEEQKAFSEIINSILGLEKADPQIISLVDVIDRAGYPFEVEDDIIAESCKSTSRALYFLQRHHMFHPENMETVQELLKLNSKMGRLESARGLLASMSDKLDKQDMGKWSEQLGEWEKALEIYKSQKQPKFSNLVKCYAHLELWEEIRNQAEIFEHMKDKEKQECALWFAWAFYHSKDLKNVQYYMKFFPQNKDLNFIHFKTMFLIASENYEAANEYIEEGFKTLTTNLSVFNGSDANEASKRMVFAQHLIELSEALQMKQDFQTNPYSVLSKFSIWQNRLKNFSHESESWMKLIEIRSLVLSPADHSDSYLKMLSVLRKERRWKLIDAYCDRFFSKANSTHVLLSKLKIMWARGDKHKAVSLLITINNVFRDDNDESIERAFNNLQIEERKNLIEFLGIKNYDRMSDIQRITVIKKIKIDHSLDARLLRIQANWQYRLYTAKTSSATYLIEICKVFKKSLKIKSDDYRTWAGWAYASSRSLSHFSDKRSEFALNAIRGFLKATQLRPSESLEYLCQMFSIFFRYGEEVNLPESVKKEIIDLPPSIINQIVPQIVVHIAHKDPKIKKVVVAIITQFGSHHFQSVVFALNVLSQINDASKTEVAEVAKNIMDSLGTINPKIYHDAKLFIDGMVRSAVSWTELWLTALDTASKAQQMNDKASVISLIQKVFEMIEKPVCQYDQIFLRNYGSSLQRCRLNFENYKKKARKTPLDQPVEASVHRAMWDGFRSLYAEMDDKMKKMDKIQLSKVSSELASKSNFELAIPGTYSVVESSPMMDKIDPTLSIMSSQQHPRSVYMYDTKGQRYRFLLKGNEDLRLDQRIMQFFNLMNSLLKNNRTTADLGVSILDYAIVPFAPNAGLITWVTGADTFQQLVTDYRNNREIKMNIELEIASQNVGAIFNSLSALQRYEVYETVKEQTKGDELRQMLWLRSPDAIAWLKRNKIFTISTALMSMAGYTIGLGDRHPSNIMVQRHTGRCLHIDFGDSFEVTMKRPVLAERVPFRLTRMMINALDSGSYEGLFRKCCEDVLYVLRENRSSITAQMEVFVHEPIFYGKEIRQSGNAQRGILERIAAKLAGNDPAPYNDPDIIYDVGTQVDTLIKKASDPREYVRHYVGWCPFW